MPFKLDPRLNNDTLPIGQLELCEIRLINDCRWPWLVLVPMYDGLSEIFDLDPTQQDLLSRETSAVASMLKELTGAAKINTGALGNIVRQLHVHVVARQENDANWPGPVWGFGSPVTYDKKDAETLISKLQSELNV